VTHHQLLRKTLSDDDPAAIRTYLKQRRAPGRDDFEATVEANTRHFAGTRTAIGQRAPNKPHEMNLPPPIRDDKQNRERQKQEEKKGGPTPPFSRLHNDQLTSLDSSTPFCPFAAST
jgi:putative transposase